MKRNKKMAPEFDDIIFENRNKSYGAYNIRKSYKSTASLSILGGITFSALLMTALSFTTEKGTVSPSQDKVIVVTHMTKAPEYTLPPVPKAPPALNHRITNQKPVVVDDTSDFKTYIPTNEEINSTSTNKDLNDTSAVAVIPDQEIPVEKKPFISVQEMPEFPGGVPALLKYIGNNLKYPVEAQNNNIQGKVILKFVVNEDGSVDRIEILRSIDPLLDNEAIRVVKTLPRFKPGRQDGVAVPVWFLLPVSFKIGTN